MKQAIPWLLAILAWALQPALADEGVPPALDLQKDGQLARGKQAVVLVLFMRPNCAYCKTVLNEFLIPLSRNSESESRLVMRIVDNSSFSVMRDFDGRPTPQRRFADANSVKLVPAVMLFDADGHVLANPLVGISSVDYYGFFLDRAIDQALAKVRGDATAAKAEIVIAP